jgi:HopA1 effector protein family
MMNDCRPLVTEAGAATRIHPPARYSWFGARSAALPSRIARTFSPGAARAYLVQMLSAQLYSDFYRRGRAEPPPRFTATSSAGRRGFEAALSAANLGRGFPDDGWRVLARDGDEVRVVKLGLELTVRPADLDGGARPDDRVAIQHPKELLAISPGFYLACGERGLDPATVRRVVRLYWNLRADGAAAFVAAATGRLNAAGAAYRLKVLNDPGAFNRCDAGVIYLDRADYPGLVGTVRRLRAELDRYLSPRTPVFTARLAPGLGFAEDPGTAESFGEHRCALLAEALVRTHERGSRGPVDLLSTVEARFAEAGIDLAAPHLSPDPEAIV